MYAWEIHYSVQFGRQTKHHARTDHRRIEFVPRYADSTAQTYRHSEHMPIRGVAVGYWLELFYRGAAVTSRIQRSSYELCLFTALREHVRCKEIWGEGAANTQRCHAAYLIAERNASNSPGFRISGQRAGHLLAENRSHGNHRYRCGVEGMSEPCCGVMHCDNEDK